MRVLLITRHLPFPPSSGAAQRSGIICEALTKYADVDVLVVSDHGAPPATSFSNCRLVGWVEVRPDDLQPYPLLHRFCPPLAKLALACSSRYGFHPSPRIRTEVHALIKSQRYDFIVARYLTTFSQCGLADCGPVIVDIDDLPTEAFQKLIVAKARNSFVKMLRQFQLQRLARSMRGLVRQCQHVWLPNAAQVQQFANASWLPNIPYPFFSDPGVPGSPPAAAARRVLFVGLMNYEPNQEAMNFYVEQVWPQVVQVIPDAQLRIVGGGVPPALQARWERQPGVVATGYIADLGAEYRGCALAIAPIFSGGGTNIKVVEAMSHARPCLLSPCAARGFEQIVRDGETALLATSPQEFARQTIQLLEDAPLGQRLGAAGRQAIEPAYSFDYIRHEIGRTIETVLEQMGQSRQICKA